MNRPERRKPNRYHGRVAHEDGRFCAAPGCKQAGEFRAPRSRTPEEDGYHWFCLDHVRAYNENWNFFDGMDPHEATRLNSRYAIWDRPTWPLGHQHRRLNGLEIEDIQSLFRGQPSFGRFAEKKTVFRDGKPLSRADRQALEALGLDETAGADDIKAQYKTLLKRYHPDTNGGDRSKERALSRVIAAYQQLADG